LDEIARSYAQAVSFLRNIYYESSLAVLRKWERETAERNKAFNKDYKNQAKTVMERIKGSAEETAQALEDVFDGKAMQQTIEQQQADAPWQALQRYASTVYGSPAKQQGVGSGGK